MADLPVAPLDATTRTLCAQVYWDMAFAREAEELLLSDGFSAIVAAGIVFGFVFQIFVNVGMTVGLAPVTGITLPFVSVGGSSLIASMAMIGLLQGIHARGRLRRG